MPIDGPQKHPHPKHAAHPAEASLGQLKKDLDALKRRLQETESGWQRTQADFDNYRRRIQEERFEMIRAGVLEVLLKVAPVLENFRRAAEHVPAEQKETDWAKGVQLIEKQLENVLLEEGLEKIEGDGEFNPHLHEAISHEPHPTVSENHIIAVAESGWKVGDKVLKPAKVRVSSGPAHPNDLNS